MSNIRVFCLVVIFVVLCPGTRCQVANTARNEPSDRKSFCEMSLGLAEKDKPNLAKDWPALEATQPELRARYAASFSDLDLQVIGCNAWMDYRQRNRDEKLDPDKFARFAFEAYGGLKVTSTPEGAAIQVDDKRWTDPTDAQSSCRVGTRHIKLSKPGYQEEFGDAVVKEGAWTPFHRNLKKK